MDASSADQTQDHLQRAARLGTYLIAAFSLAALVGWFADLPTLTSIRAGLASTSVATAICFLLSAFSIHQLTLEPQTRLAGVWPWRGSAVIVVVVALYALAEYAAGDPQAGFLFGPNLGRVSPATATDFLLLAAAVLSVDSGRGRVSAALVAIGLIVTELDLVGYAYGIDALYRVMPFTAMALPTALAFAILFAALLLARPRQGWIQYAARGDRVGAAFRLLLPAVILIPFALAYLMVTVVGNGLLDPPFGFAVFAVVTTVLLGGMVCLVAAWLARADATLRHTEMQLVQAQKMEAIGNLTGGMAHDFNNLLGIIIGNLDMASASAALSEDDRTLVGDALEAALHGAELTRRLLAFARRQPLRPERVDLNELVEDIVKLLSRTLGQSIEISLNLAQDVWPVIVDPAQFEASLANLATNAKDAMPDGGKLTITTMNTQLDADYASQFPDVSPGDYALIEVSDTGTGMTPEVAARIFEPFFTTKPQGKGTGLGLSMVFGFLKQSGGHINVYTEPGIGTTFRLYLPRAMQEGDVPGMTERGPLARGSGEIVLVVEDNAALRRVVLRQISEIGYRVLEAENAADALARLAREKVDLVFTDVIMAGEMDGYGLACKIGEQWPAVKVMLTSGFPQAKAGHGARYDEAFTLLSKPYRRRDLARALHEAFDR